MRRIVGSALVVVLLVGAGACAPPPSYTPLPVFYNLQVAAAAGLANPQGSPPGSNNWNCKPGSAHPRPVVLVHGTFASATLNWNALSPLLANNGYCVFALNFGGPPLLGISYGLADMASSAEELSTYVDRVLAATGASKVDIVGHSQGGLMPRYYLKDLGGAAKVNALVALSPSSHGTTFFGFTDLLMALVPGLTHALVDPVCTACTQQYNGSDFLNTLNSGGDTVPGVKYTVIQTRYDEIVTPYQSAFLTGTDVTNIEVQYACDLDFGGHITMAFDHVALQFVLNALDPAHAQTPACTPVLFGVGG